MQQIKSAADFDQMLWYMHKIWWSPRVRFHSITVTDGPLDQLHHALDLLLQIQRKQDP